MPEPKSPLLEIIQENIPIPDYLDDELTYLKGLRKRLEHARNHRDQIHFEFDGMTYAEYHNLNEWLANTHIEPKKNKEDSNFQSGTIRQKIYGLLAAIVSLDLSGNISAFDKNGYKIQSLGDAMEDVIYKTDELDGDKEKKQVRHYELLKQGTVFIEEIWDERNKTEKKLDGKFTGQLNVTWATKIKKAFAQPARNIIPGINVYLGDLTKYNITDQPYIFTVDFMPYDEAKTMFGDWDRWENVPKKLKIEPLTQTTSTFNFLTWRLLQPLENYVEIIRYQDKWNNEFAILINGILMTPVGLPLPWGYEDYNIAQQNLEPIHSKFAYGKSFASKIRNKVAILDEMMRLAVLKTQKSFMPPYTNISGRVLSNRVLMPGKISYGIPPNTLVPINDKEAQGLTTAELSMITQLRDSINAEDTPPMAPSMHTGKPNVTEILEYQRQARLWIGLTIFSISMLEWKLEWLRLQNLLANWFNPEDQVVDEIRGELKNKYREISVQRSIQGQGMGTKMIIPTDNVPIDGKAIMQAEDIVSKEQGQPVRFIFLNPEEVKSAKLCWQITVIPREMRTSENEKLLFRAEMQDAQQFGPTLNLEYLQEKFANVWGEDPKKMFKSAQQMQQEQQPQPGSPTTPNSAPGGTPTPKVSPSVNPPTMGQGMGQQMKKAMMTA